MLGQLKGVTLHRPRRATEGRDAQLETFHTQDPFAWCSAGPSSSLLGESVLTEHRSLAAQESVVEADDNMWDGRSAFKA